MKRTLVPNKSLDAVSSRENPALVMSRFTNMFGKINDTRVSSIYICVIKNVSIESEVSPKIRADEYETR